VAKNRVETPLESFDRRFEDEGVQDMSREEWNAWLDTLTEDEFIAMCERYGTPPTRH
jgi:hypothetical protein